MMKSISSRFGLVAACVAVSLLGRVIPVAAAETDQGGPGDHLQRLEQRVNELAQQQEHLMRQLAAQQEHQAAMAGGGPEPMRPMGPLRDRARMDHPMPPEGAPALAGIPGSSGGPSPAARLADEIAGMFKLCLLVGFVFNILVAVWIHTDIRKRGEGSGIFIALAVLAGVPTAIIYSLVRIAEKKP
jgi:hypothetical protein